MPINNIHRRLRRLTEFFEEQFNWSAAPATSVRLSCPPRPVTNDPPNEAEVHKELQLLKRYKSLGDEIDARIMKARTAYYNLRYLWRLRDVNLALKGRIYNALMRAVLLYACETWSL
ncbi:unnamed protein product [Schistosoma rodhaini]|uniref:Uncharacterized protein n=1 Tax=Schistosoma rodhaini TaxID=6188 RepID=A0A183QNB3_9TREM|nr:unnamed protein product [Schistosoma rodhaini]